jgi:death on curing protein
MIFQLLSATLVDAIHDSVVNPGELVGRAMNKSLEGALARIENRLNYGLITDVFELAAAYAVAISQGHCYNDGKKRTAHQAMDTCLDLNGVQITWTALDIGPVIVRTTQGLLDEGELGHWLRIRA